VKAKHGFTLDLRRLRKDQWLTLAIVAVGVTTFVLVFYLPQVRQLGQLQQEFDQTGQSLHNDRARLLELTLKRPQFDRSMAKAVESNRRLPDSQDLGLFLKDISNYAQLCGLEDPTFQPQKARQAGSCWEMPVQMRFSGNFAELFRFLRQARIMPRVTRVSTMNVLNDSGLAGKVKIDLVMNVFFTRG
jgi:Tfp pilus assembly protein PilO